MRKFEIRLCIFAIVFVAVYIGAITVTIHSRVNDEQRITRFEAVGPAPGEGHIMLAELFLPMVILFTVTVCFIIVKKNRAKAVHKLEESEEGFQ